MISFYLAKKNKFINMATGEEVKEVTLGILIGSNGMFFRSSTAGHNITRPINEELSKFDKIEDSIEFHYPTISYETYGIALSFCRKVFEDHQSEANLLLVLDRSKKLEDQQYRIVIPKQEVGSSSVEYKLEDVYKELDENEFLAGTIHSHPDFSAFQSGVDHSDEINFDGIHITLGHIKNTNPDIHSRICIGGIVYEPKENVIQTTLPVGDFEVPEQWYDKVKKKTYIHTGNIYQRQIGFIDGEYNYPISKPSIDRIKKYLKLIKPQSPINQKNQSPIILMSEKYNIETELTTLE